MASERVEPRRAFGPAVQPSNRHGVTAIMLPWISRQEVCRSLQPAPFSLALARSRQARTGIEMSRFGLQPQPAGAGGWTQKIEKMSGLFRGQSNLGLLPASYVGSGRDRTLLHGGDTQTPSRASGADAVHDTGGTQPPCQPALRTATGTSGPTPRTSRPPRNKVRSPLRRK